MQCPCGSDKDFASCCQPIIKGEQAAGTAEALMRARYTAYTQVELEFLHDSLHPDRREDNDPEGARDWAENSQWHGLEIIETKAGGPDDEHGQVEFVASYTHEGESQNYHEVAEFSKIDGTWYFEQGRPGVQKPVVRDQPKIGRNDPCPCGSGKKYKRCCAG